MIEEKRGTVATTLAKIGARTWVQLLLIVLLGILVYSNSFHVPFFFDDEGSITDNPIIWRLGTFLGEEGLAYNPRRFIGYMTLALNYRFGGLDVTGYHLVNLIIHLVSALLVYALGRLTLQTLFFRDSEGEIRSSSLEVSVPGSRFPNPIFIPLFAALLFVAHPVQTQAVTYIVQRFASLAAMFYLAAVVSYARGRLRHEEYGVSRALPWYLLSLVAALLALGTKETAATLPFALLLYEFWFFLRNRRKKLLVLLSGFSLAAVIVSIAVPLSGKSPGQFIAGLDALSRETPEISRIDYLFTQFAVIATYLRLLVLPVNQTLDYNYPLYHSFLIPQVFLSFLLLLALFGLAIYLYYRSTTRPLIDAATQGIDPSPFTIYHLRIISFGILWFFLTLSVESSIIPIRDVIFEHRLYLPSAGLFLAAAAFLTSLRRVPEWVVWTTAVGVVLVLAGATLARNSVWKNEIGMWKDVAAKSPWRGRPHHNLARAYEHEGLIAEAVAEYTTALQLDPSFSDTYTNLGAIYRREGRIDEAVSMHRTAIRLAPLNPGAWLNLGVAYAVPGNYADAEKMFREALRLEPRYAEAHFNLGNLYRLEWNPVKAEEEYRAAVAINPIYAGAYHELGILCATSGRRSEAVAFFQRASTLSPGNTIFAADLRAILSSGP